MECVRCGSSGCVHFDDGFFSVLPDAPIQLSRQSIFFWSSYWFSMRFFIIFYSCWSSTNIYSFIRSIRLQLFSANLSGWCAYFFPRLLRIIFIHRHQHRRRHIIGMRWCDSMKILAIYSRVKCEIATYRKTWFEKICEEDRKKSKREARQAICFYRWFAFPKKNV